ncbi:hypothetical protein Tco_0139370, partial [Tanacetum coccineum]
EKIVPYPRFISLLLEHMMPKYDIEELIINPTQVFSVHNWTLKPNQPEEPPFTIHMKAICNLDVPVDSKAPKPSSQTKEVPQVKKLGAKSGLKRKQSSKHTSESKNEASKSKTGQLEKDTQSSSAKDESPSHPSTPTPVVGEMHKEAYQAAGSPTSFGATSEEGAHPQISSGHEASDMDEGTKTYSFDHIFAGSNTSVLVNKTKSARDGLKTVHNESDESEEEEADKGDTYDTSHDVLEDTSVPPPPSLKSAQIQELMAQFELSKLLASHNFASCLPTDLKELPSKFTKLSGEIKELKQYVKDMKIELPGDLKEILTKLETFTSTISSLTSQFAKLKNIQWELPTEFQAIPALDVPSAGQATASPAEGEKNTRDADTNLKDELVDLLGKNVMTQYYTKKLLFDRYCDKMLKRKKIPKIKNFEVLTKKGPITLKIYREDGSDEVISNLKVSDLHSAEWREVIQACPDKSDKGWKTIYDLVKTRLDQLTQTKQELKIDLNIGDGVVRFVLYDVTKPQVPSCSKQLDHVRGLLHDQHGGFTLALLDSLFLKRLRTIKSIPPKCRLGFSRALKGALDKVICGSLQLVRETLAESSLAMLDVDDEHLNIGDATLKDLKTKHHFKHAPSLPVIPIDHHYLIASPAMVLDRIKSYACYDSLLLTPLCCDDIHDVTPRVSALAGYDKLLQRNEFASHRLPQREGNINGWLIKDEDEPLEHEASDKEVDLDLEFTANSKPNGPNNNNNEENPDIAAIIAQQLQTILPQIITQVTNNVNNTNGGNGGNGENNGCTYKGLMACNPKEYDGKGGAIALTRWIKKTENVIDNSGCAENQKVKYATSSFMNKFKQEVAKLQ